MSTFDYIHCKYPLPVQGVNDLDFQTKSLENCMDQYEIREDGTFWRQVCRFEDHSNPDSDDPLERLAGSLTRVPEGWAPVMDACTVYFYGLLPGKTPDNGWVEFKAQFVDGKLHKLEIKAPSAA